MLSIPQHGFIYLLPIGEADGQDVFLEVALKSGHLNVLGIHQENELQGLKQVIQ